MPRKFNSKRIDFKVCFLSSLLAFCFVLITLFSLSYAQKFKYPVAKTDNVVDDYFGTKVADPYRWLENPDSPETQAWVEAENKLTYNFLNSIPQREKIKAKLTKLWNYPKYSVPIKKGERYFYTKNDGLQNQSVYYMQESLNSKPIMVIDPNKLSPDGTIALTIPAFSMDGKLLAYGISKSGSDWQEVRILNIETGKEYPEVIKWLKFSNVAWKHNNQGFYYNRYPEPGSVPEEDQYSYSRVYYHKLGTSQSEDLLIYEQPETKEFDFTPFITEDGKYLVLIVEHGTDPKNRIYYREVQSNGPFIKLLDKADANYTFISNLDTLFYFRTDLDAPNGRIIQININNPSPNNWKEIISQKKEVLSFADMVNHQLVLVYMQDAKHKMMLHNLNGVFLKEIKLPDLGSIGSISARTKR